MLSELQLDYGKLPDSVFQFVAVVTSRRELGIAEACKFATSHPSINKRSLPQAHTSSSFFNFQI